MHSSLFITSVKQDRQIILRENKDKQSGFLIQACAVTLGSRAGHPVMYNAQRGDLDWQVGKGQASAQAVILHSKSSLTRVMVGIWARIPRVKVLVDEQHMLGI